jgi:hypothetical protein
MGIVIKSSTDISVSGTFGVSGTTTFIDEGSARQVVLGGILADGSELVAGSNAFLFVSGTIDTSEQGDTDTAVFAGDVFISGGLGVGYAATQAADGNVQSFYVESKEDGKLFKVDGNNHKVIIGAENSGQTVFIPSDSIFFVSGNIGGGGDAHKLALFGGDVFVSGGMEVGFPSGESSDGSIQSFIINGKEEAKIFLVDSNNEQIVIGAASHGQDIFVPSDAILFVSGADGGRETQHNAVSVFGGDVVVSGSLFAKQKHILSVKFDSSNTDLLYVRFNAAGSNGSPGVNNKFIAPYSGRVIKISARSTSAPGSTEIGLHKRGDGTANLDTSATADVTVNMASANTSYDFEFGADAVFGHGDIIGISFNPSSAPNDTDLTVVLEFDTYLH